MDSGAIPVHHRPEANRLGPALLAATMLHALLIFGVSFKTPPPDTTSPGIEVTLAQHQAQDPPEDADYLARFDQRASGDREKARELTTDRIAPLEAPDFRQTQPLAAPATEQVQKEAAADDRVSRPDRDAPRRDRRREETREGSEIPPNPPAREIASLRAKLALQRQLHSRIPRTLVLTSVSARASEQAEYLRHWIEWVEKIGNENYPEEARRKQIFGEIRLAVAIERDGSVASVEILESSGHRVLDQAAIRIVRLATPFRPIPASIEADRIEIIRTWHFVPGDQLTTSGS